MAYDNTNTGILFINKDRKNDKSPNFSGNLNINGKEYRLVAWSKTSANGNKFLSLAIEESKKQQRPTGAENTPSGFKEEPIPLDFSAIADEIPF